MMALGRLLVVAAALSGALSSGAAAQRHDAALVGSVRDSSGAPVDNADVELLVPHILVRSDTGGRFALHGLAPGSVTVLVRHMGYDPQRVKITLRGGVPDTLRVTISENALLLAAMETEAALQRRYAALSGFYRRRARGAGVFFTREQLEQTHTNKLSEVLRGVPGLEFTRQPGGREALRVPESQGREIDCPPQFWVDGQRVYDIDIDDFVVSDVEALEIYSGPATTPSQFAQSAGHYTCGTIVLWTRVPGA